MTCSRKQLAVDLAACQSSAWYPTFQKQCYAAHNLSLSSDDEAFITSDAINSCHVERAIPTRTVDPYVTEDFSDSDSDDSARTTPEYYGLAALKDRIDAKIADLGGRVIPKLNWSAPKDAAWISMSGLVCHNADEVLLLLQASDRAAYDLELLASLRTESFCSQAHAQQQDSHTCQPNQHRLEDLPAAASCTNPVNGPTHDGAGVDLSTAGPAGTEGSPDSGESSADGWRWRGELVLKKCFDLKPEREFRCFVKGHKLVGICQRDPTQHFPQILPERIQITETLTDFHEHQVRAKFPLHSYTYDVYVTTKDIVRLLDFNPVGAATQPLLFTWDDLELQDYVHASISTTGETHPDPGVKASCPSESKSLSPLLTESVPGTGVSHNSCSNCVAGAVEQVTCKSEGTSDVGNDGVKPEIRLVEDSLHIQAGAATALGVPSDVTDMHGMGWGDLMVYLQEQTQLE